MNDFSEGTFGDYLIFAQYNCFWKRWIFHPCQVPSLLKTVAESHNHRKAVGGEVWYWEASKSKGCSNQIKPLDESQYGGNFLIDVALLHSSREKEHSDWDVVHYFNWWCLPVFVYYLGGGEIQLGGKGFGDY